MKLKIFLFYFYNIYNNRSFYFDDYDNITDVFFYSCITSTNNNTLIKDSESSLQKNIIIITMITMIILIIFYSVYKKSISKDKKYFQKNKIFINNYTLVLHKLKINTEDFNQEMSDLISFLNNIIKEHKQLFMSFLENYKEINDLNVFDISISNVNEKNIEIFKKIKSLQTKVEDIMYDNDSIKNKVKNNIREIYRSMHNIVVNLSDNENKEENEKNEDNVNKEISPEKEEDYNIEKQIKLGKTKTLINENMNKITVEITKLHKEYNLKYYADIYITFRNQLISNLIYDIYNKGKIIRFFSYIFCQSKKLRKYYYKNQWLNFNLAKENPSDIKWENCYFSTWKKMGRRFLSILLSICFIVIISLTMVWIKTIENEEEEISKIENKDNGESSGMSIIILLMIILTQIINIVSSKVLKIFTNFEKYSSKSKEIFSNISKNYWLNLLISFTIFFKKGNPFVFSYNDFEDYVLLNEVIILNMLSSIAFAQASSLFFYVFNLLKRFSDSKYNNGKTTEIKNKIKYEELYLGPEFPFEERYGTILVNLSICLLYGTNSPVINFFFVGFLIVTFLVDKFLMIYYYRKPPLYGNLISKKMTSYFFFAVLLYVYGLFYNVSNPYIFNNSLLKYAFQYERFSYKDIREILGDIYCIFNPFTFIYMIYCEIFKDQDLTFLYYNFNSNILLVHLFVFVIFFFNPTSFIKKTFTPKSKLLSFLNISHIEIGTIYSLEDLKKYYEIKKLQLFNLIIDCDYKGENKDNYSHLINNYMSVIRYIKENIDNKNKKFQKIYDNNLVDANNENSPLKNDIVINGNKLQISGDISYNQSFISKYEVYNNFSLMKNI